jgi:hypothetical protein
MVAVLIACVPLLQGALFDAGGALRRPKLGQVTISTMVVAASMVPIPSFRTARGNEESSTTGTGM